MSDRLLVFVGLCFAVAGVNPAAAATTVEEALALSAETGQPILAVFGPCL
ncbi:MAG: hypothetical protein N2C14_22840 [Planctomycetales bacterium]